MGRRMRAALLALLVLVAGSAAAVGGPVEGRLAFDGPARLAGDADVSSPEGVLNLTAMVQEGRAPAFSWSAARGWVVVSNWTTARAGAQPFRYGELPVNDTLALGAGGLRDLACGEGCLVLAFGLDPAARVGFTGPLDAPLRWLPEGELFYAEDAHEGRENAFRLEMPPGTFAFDGAQVTPHASGRVGLLVRSAAATVERDGGARVVDTRTQTVRAGDPLGLAGAERARSGFLYLELDSASLASEPGPARLDLREGTLRLAGAVEADAATGTLHAGAGDVLLHGDPVRLEGDWTLDLAPLDVTPAPLLEDAPAPRPEADVRGEASGIFVKGASVRLATRDRVALGAQVAALLVAAAMAIGLYTRIGPSAVLDNPRRRLLLERVRAFPGATATELARDTAMGRVLTQYHLRMLQQNALVAGRPDGRQTRWFPPEAALDADVFTLRQMLGDETRRRLAEEIAAAQAPGLTQRELAQRTRASQRLVSYHVRRLLESGLVRAAGSYPERYAATERLMAAAGNAAQANDIGV